jgi:hypothetical protein
MIVIVVFLISFRFRFQDEGEIKKQAFWLSVLSFIRVAKRIFGP